MIPHNTNHPHPALVRQLQENSFLLRSAMLRRAVNKENRPVLAKRKLSLRAPFLIYRSNRSDASTFFPWSKVRMLPETRMPLNSLSPNADRLAELKALFPEAFSENRLDFDRLKQVLGEAVHTDRERYGLNWAGKTNAIHALQSLSVGTLKPDRNASVNFDTTEHMIIEGDNLEVLKLLQKSYFGKVKMIYIDPPYNTGNEFIYPDNFREGLEDYLKYTGQLSAEGTATTSNKETDGRYHSNWLSMMYPRIFLAKNLLRDDGVVFISIDDHEVHNLRLLMNEIFGEENFIATVIWQKVYSPKNTAMHFSEDHDYIVVYARNAEVWRPELLPRGEEANARYINPDNDPRGPWKPSDLTARNYYSNGMYEIVSRTGQIFKPAVGTYWRSSYDKFLELDRDNRIWWGSDGKNMPSLKRFLSEVKQGITPQTLWDYKSVGHTQEAKQELLEFVEFEDTQNVLNSVKPTRLIQRMLQIATEPDGEDIVVDFFAGSGTTAHAVMRQNEEDGGNRQYICVQLPHRLPKPERRLKTLFDITTQRVQRVINKYDEDTSKLRFAGDTKRNRGVKVFRLAASNFKIWEDGNLEEDADAVAAQLELFADNLLPDATPEDILFEILIKAGYDLNVSREEITVAGQSVYSIAEGRQLVCLERDITRETLAGMIARKPEGVICLDEAFHGDDALLTNTLLQMQDAGIRFQTI